MTPIPFTLNIPEADIEDLKARLTRTRLPDQAPGAPWAYGTDLAAGARLVALADGASVTIAGQNFSGAAGKLQVFFGNAAGRAFEVFCQGC